MAPRARRSKAKSASADDAPVTNGHETEALPTTAGPSDPAKAFAKYTHALDTALRNCIARFEERRISARETEAIPSAEVDSIVDNICSQLPDYDSSHDVTRVALEKALTSAVVGLVSGVTCVLPLQPATRQY